MSTLGWKCDLTHQEEEEEEESYKGTITFVRFSTLPIKCEIIYEFNV
jgi:hypothetical protein